MSHGSSFGLQRCHAALLTLLLAMAAGPVHAQDRLVVHGQEVGAHGHFGQKLGDMPPWLRRATGGDPEWIAGGRYVKTLEYTPGASPSLPLGT